MTERLVLPPPWCGAICRNAMSEVCLEHCALKRDTSAFDPKDIPLADMPRFPKTEGMTREERFTSVTIYLSKVVDHLQGVEDEYSTFVIRRPSTDSKASSRLSPVVEIQSVLHGISKAIAPPQDREECQSQAVRSEEMAGTSD